MIKITKKFVSQFLIRMQNSSSRFFVEKSFIDFFIKYLNNYLINFIIIIVLFKTNKNK